MIHRFLFITLFCAGIVFPSTPPAPVAQINNQLQLLTESLEAIPASPDLLARDAERIDAFFTSTIGSNGAIVTLARIDLDGTVLNLVSARGAASGKVSVAKERWFSTLGTTKKPYTGTARDKNGRTLLFRAWPIIETVNGVDRMTGVVSAKINVRDYLSSVSPEGTTPLVVLYRGSPLYSRNWNSNRAYAEETIALAGNSGSDRLTIRYEIPGTVARVEPENATVAVAAAPSRHDSPFSVSPDPRRLKKLALAGGAAAAFVLAVLATLLFLLSRRPRHETGRFRTINRSKPFEAILLDDELSALSGDLHADDLPFITESDTLEECLSIERETRRLPVIQELITESSKMLHDDKAVDPVTRDRILRKIQGDLTLWVRGEFKHLFNHLSQVRETIQACEQKDGGSAELQELRREIGKIMEEVAKLEQKLPREMMVEEKQGFI